MIPSHQRNSVTRGRILYEVENLTLKSGTGIATYAGNLGASGRRLGYETHAVFSVARTLGRKDLRLNEILAFDAVPTERISAFTRTSFAFRSLLGLHPVEIPQSGLVVRPAADRFSAFERLFAAPHLIDAAVGHFWLYGRLASLKPPVRPDIFHASHAVPMAVKGSANIYTIHDLIPLRMPYATLDDKRYYYRMMMELARSADHIVTVSEHSRRDIIQFLGVDERRVTNTYQPVEIPARFLARTEDEVAAELENLLGLAPGGYFLFFGAIEPKKNVSRLVDAYAASGSKLPLVIVGGKGWQNSADLKKLRDERFTSYRLKGDRILKERAIIRLDYVSQEKLTTLIRGARAVLFPSLYEGFGLPVIEAMLLGTPVVTSNSTSLAEVSGGAGLLIDPYSVDSIANGIRTIERDEDLRNELAKKGIARAAMFSATAHDQRLAEVYRSV